MSRHQAVTSHASEAWSGGPGSQRSAGITGLHTPPALHSDHTESSTFLPEWRETHKKRSQVYSPPGHQMYPPITVCHCWLLYTVGSVFSLQTVLGTIHPFYLLSNCPIIFSKVNLLIQQLSLFPSLELRLKYPIRPLCYFCLGVYLSASVSALSCTCTTLFLHRTDVADWAASPLGSCNGPGRTDNSKLLRYRHVALMSVLLLHSHAFFDSDRQTFTNSTL